MPDMTYAHFDYQLCLHINGFKSATVTEESILYFIFYLYFQKFAFSVANNDNNVSENKAGSILTE